MAYWRKNLLKDTHRQALSLSLSAIFFIRLKGRSELKQAAAVHVNQIMLPRCLLLPILKPLCPAFGLV